MKLKALFFSASLCLSMMLASAGFAQPLQPLDYEPEWLQQMYAQGWQKIEEGVLQRGAEEGQLETFTYGVEGLQWVVESYEQKIASLEERYADSPDEKLAELIQSLRDQVEALNIQTLTAPAAEELQGEVLDACSFSFNAPVFAGPSQSSQGVMATAQAVWQNDCNYQGEVYAYAYTHAKDGTVDNTSFDLPPLETGASVQVSAIANVVGSTECYSTASARVTVPALSINHLPPDAENYSCSAPPVVTSISGPASVATDSYVSSGCANVTWTASATGGHAGGYTYTWYLAAMGAFQFQGSGSTFTKSYCNTSGNVTVKVIASDSDGHTDDATFTTAFSNRGAIAPTISGPTSVSTNSTTPCANVTWTASATGNGHTGFTYKWYFGTTLQGSGTSLTKQYCNTSQTVSVKLVATASDGHTGQDTHSTTITHTTPSPPTASISGPTTIALATSTECRTITWTASATGGTPGYTYKWYIGTTAQSSTTTTLTKTYCGPQTITVKVVVTDVAAQIDDATHTTQLTYTQPSPTCPPFPCTFPTPEV